MPRVNRDLQRRMAARRERERRRPSERRYQFAAPGAEDALLEQDGEVAEETQAAPPASRTATTAAVATRGGVRATPKPFSEYKDEYAYVYSDLRRVAAVIGGLLAALVILYFVLVH
jgi:hypothetical protein